MGEQNELKNRYLIIDVPDNWNSTQETTDSTQEKIIAELRIHPSSTRNLLAKVIGITPDGIKKQLDKLKKSGIIQHVGPNKGGHWEIVNG